jgi:hypothetical protein
LRDVTTLWADFSTVLQTRIKKLVRVYKSYVLDLERNVPFQVQSYDVHAAIRLSTFLVVFGRYAFVEISKNVVGIVVFEIAKHYRDKNSVSVLLI